MNETDGYIEVFDQDFKVGEITFIYMDKQIINVNHTYVNPKYRGKGIAKKLIEKLVEMSRNNELKILASCPYVKAELSNSYKYNDLIFNK